MVQQSDFPSQKTSGQASDGRLHFQVPREIQKSRNQERQHGTIYDGMPKREQRGASSSSGRNGSLPVAQASEERLQSSLKEDDDIRNLLSTGVELNPVFLKRN